MAKRRLFDNIREDIKNEVDKVAKTRARVAIDRIIDLTPVWSGAYAESHRVSVNGKAVDGPVQSPPVIGEKMPSAMAASLKNSIRRDLMRKVDRAKVFTKIRLLNGTDHAVDVEYGGDRTSPRYVYKSARRAAESAPIRIGKIGKARQR